MIVDTTTGVIVSGTTKIAATSSIKYTDSTSTDVGFGTVAVTVEAE